MLSSLSGMRILLVEDEYILAMDIVREIEGLGGEVLGPARSVDHAFALLHLGPQPHAAILDIRLMDEKVYPVADALRAMNCLFIFASNENPWSIPDAYRDVRHFTKPIDMALAVEALLERVGDGSSDQTGTAAL